MELLGKAVALLKKDRIRNYCLIEMIKGADRHEADILNESVFIRLLGNESFVMLSAQNQEEGNILLERNLKDTDRTFFTIGEWPVLFEGKDVKFRSSCVQLYLPESVRVQGDDEGVVALTPEMAPYIHERYDHKNVVTVDYIKERIRVGPAFGVMENGVPAGWVMTHEEGTMGVLTVLPEYRRMGYAKKLNAALIKSLREQGKPCLVHIIKGNLPSLSLAEKTGFEYSCDVEWIVLN